MLEEIEKMVGKFMGNLDEAGTISERLKEVDMSKISPMLVMQYILAMNELTTSLEKVNQTAKQMIVYDAMSKKGE